MFEFTALVTVGVGMLLVYGFSVIIRRYYIKIEQGKALIINALHGDPQVSFTGAVVYPIINKAETMDISVKTMEIDRRGKEGLICRDNIRADIKVLFFVRVNKTRDDVIKVAQAIGCNRASHQDTLVELFSAKFSEALKTVGKQLDFIDLYTKRHEFRDQIVSVIGRDLNGYVLEDAAIDFLEQTPLASLDPHNILDAQGIRKITELTAVEHVRTNEYANNEKKQIRKQDVEAAEAIMELDRQQAEAQAKQQREIESVRAREGAEVLKVQAEERLRSESTRIQVDQEIQVREQNREREVAVAGKNRERVLGVETERVEKDRALEAISREREVELQRIDKEKALEKERKEIQDVIRQRVVVQKSVVEEEERMKTIRVMAEAQRQKDAAIVLAEGVAQEGLVKDIKAAEAAEMASRMKAKESINLAEAKVEMAEREAKSKIRLAEGLLAESAAIGLAEARVKEAAATATEKYGLAESVVLREKGLAQAKVLEAEAVAREKLGLTEATILREKGVAESGAIQARLNAEAAGLAEKAKAIKAMDDAGRVHEEFRLRIERERTVELEAIRAQREVAESQARILSEAFKTAKIDIVGGDLSFFQNMIGAVSLGKSIDSFFNRSDSVRGFFQNYLSGDGNLVKDVRDILTKTSSPAGGSERLTVGGLLGRLLESGDDARKEKVGKLLEAARSMGIEQTHVN
ncbi:MAG: flotillin family protein [Planctomycetes bacterium]|nr:flotillin family protein [Planctomycetota bacterium]